MNDTLSVEAEFVARYNAERRHERLDRLEAEIMRLPKADIEIIHHFPPMIYAREMRVKAGSIITGKVHRTSHLNIVSAGRLTVYNELTGEKQEVCAPAAFVSEAGTRRAAVVHSDVVWTTVHPRREDETTPEQLEARLIEPHTNTLIAGLKQPEVLTTDGTDKGTDKTEPKTEGIPA